MGGKDFRVFFLRHGESTGNRKAFLQGRMDYKLTREGENETIALANYWKHNRVHIDQIISSPLKRTIKTSKIISEIIGAPIELNDLYNARDFGNGQGVQINKVKSLYLNEQPPSLYDPIYETGESEWEVHARACMAINDLMKRPGGNYLIVSHGNFLNASLHVIFGVLPLGRSNPIELALKNSSYAELFFNSLSSRWSLISFNERTHLINKG